MGYIEEKKVGVAGFEPLPFSRGSSLINSSQSFIVFSKSFTGLFKYSCPRCGDYYDGDVCQTCGYPWS
jgi:hypothetical protein